MVKPFEPEELVAQEASINKHFCQQRQSNVNGDNEGTKSGSLRCTLDPELRVVQFAKGLANRDIADELNVSQRTVESHVSNTEAKPVPTTTELARWAIENQMA